MPDLPQYVGNDRNIDQYVFPSQKKMAKFPVVHIAGNEDRFIDWLADHPEIDKKVPPIYQNFVIESATTTVLVCYNDTVTAFYTKAWYNGLHIASTHIDYNECVGTQFRLNLKSNQKAVESHAPEWIVEYSQYVSMLVIAVQAYMLYHKPELVEQIYTPGESHPTRSKKHKVTAQPIRIRKTKIKRITLTDDDTPKKEIHYNKLSWHVRGHYRHVGKDKHLVYIQPSVHTRNGKRYSLKTQTYELTED